MPSPVEIYVDPVLSQAPVIRVDGVCYSRVGLTDRPPTVYAIEAEYYDCEACAQSSSSSSSSPSSSSASSKSSSSSSGCPQGPPGSGCGGFPSELFNGVTPATIYATFSGFDLTVYEAPNCYLGCNGGAVQWAPGDTGRLNGLRVAVQQDPSNPCHFTAVVTCPMTITRYVGSPNCGPGQPTVTYNTLIVDVTFITDGAGNYYVTGGFAVGNNGDYNMYITSGGTLTGRTACAPVYDLNASSTCLSTTGRMTLQ